MDPSISLHPGHALGRILMLELALKRMEAVFETLQAGVIAEEYGDRHEVTASLFSLARIGKHFCKEARGEGARLKQMINAQMGKTAAATPLSQEKEGR